MIDTTKTYRTRAGNEVRIYATDGMPPNCIHGAAKEGDKWISLTWEKQGNFRSDGEICGLDLIEVKPTRTVWLNCYDPESESYGYPTREEAEEYADPTRTACVKVTYTEGEGL